MFTYVQVNILTINFTSVLRSPIGMSLTTGPLTVEELISLLKSKCLVYNFRFAEERLSALLNAYERDGKMEIKTELETSGFYLMGDKIQVYGYKPQDYTQQNILECTKLLNDLASRYKRPKIFASTIKWGIIAPFSYVLKQIGDKNLCLPWKYDYGTTHAGKTTNGEIDLKIWRIDDTNHKKGFSAIDTKAKMGFVIESAGTFPMLINEMPDLNDPKYRDLVESMKNGVQDKNFRDRVEGSKLNRLRTFPALCLLLDR
jgi:hypothetical protein